MGRHTVLIRAVDAAGNAGRGRDGPLGTVRVKLSRAGRRVLLT